MDQGMNIGILENDFGAVNVDMMLLQDIAGEQCTVEMVAGGCDRDCHRRRFKTKLIAMGMCGYDRVLIEPSGIFDMDEFFDALHESPLDRWYEIGNVIAVVDARLEENLSEEAEFILASEVADAGCILLSKVQEADEEDIRKTTAHLNRAMEAVQCGRKFKKEIIAKDWDTFSEADYKKIASCEYAIWDYEKRNLDEDEGFESLYFMHVHMTKGKLLSTAQQLLQDEECGHIFRIKGFMPAEDGSWLELNATANEITLRPIGKGQEIMIVIGENLNEEAIREYWEEFV